jgi:hypothetical protein
LKNEISKNKFIFINYKAENCVSLCFLQHISCFSGEKKFLSCFIADGKLWKFLWSELQLSFAETAEFFEKEETRTTEWKCLNLN